MNVIEWKILRRIKFFELSGYTGGTSSAAFKATWYPGLFPPLPFLREKSWAWGCFTRDVLQEFTFGDKGSNQRCSYSQKRKNTLNHRYLETNTKPLVSVRKLHKHRRSRLTSLFETQILPPLRHRLPQCGFKNCDITTNTQIISIENDYLMHKNY